MRRFFIFFVICILTSSCEPPSQKEELFSFHLFQEPLHLDPARSRASSASYFFYNTLRGLYRIDENNELRPEGGQCQWKTPLLLKCQLEKSFWSNGDPVTADDYIRSFIHLISPKTASPRANLLDHLQNAQKIIKGDAKPETLGVRKRSERSFQIQFQSQDPEFLYKLASTALYPLHQSHRFHIQHWQHFIVNGPYQISTWKKGREMILKPNPRYQKGHKSRPNVRVFFIDDEMTSFRLYEKGKLSFLRRIPSNLIDKVKNRDDFFQKPMLRFDYIGFGHNLLNKPKLRKALAHAIDYKELKVLLRALERPGCPSIPKRWMNKQPCFDLDLNKARKLLGQVSPKDLASVYKMKVSQLGGHDIKKQAEFFQNQWKKHLGLKIEVSQVEQKVFLNELRTTPPDIFRKGVGLDRPTCLNALETFADDGKQNFISLKNSEYAEVINQMIAAPRSTLYKSKCQQGVEFLMDRHLIIPLGEMYFSLMAHPTFTGWTLNGLNQLDLSQVRPTTGSKNSINFDN